jgi:hypothetical protein
LAEFEAKYPPEAFAPEQPPLDAPQKSQEEKSNPEQQQKADTQPDQPDQTASQPHAESTGSESKEQAQISTESVGVETNDGTSNPTKTDGTSANVEESAHDQNEAHRDDDGGEVVEDNEDTVIY